MVAFFTRLSRLPVAEQRILAITFLACEWWVVVRAVEVLL